MPSRYCLVLVSYFLTTNIARPHQQISSLCCYSIKVRHWHIKFVAPSENMLLLQAAMWNQTVWPVIPRKQQEKEQPSNEALITELWDQLVSIYALFLSMLSTSYKARAAFQRQTSHAHAATKHLQCFTSADNGQECPASVLYATFVYCCLCIVDALIQSCLIYANGGCACSSQAKVDYFSPLLWRVDVYGNVLYRFADAGTSLSWSVDHHFPIARGGLSKMANMRIVQSHAHINKADR